MLRVMAGGGEGKQHKACKHAGHLLEVQVSKGPDVTSSCMSY